MFKFLFQGGVIVSLKVSVSGHLTGQPSPRYTPQSLCLSLGELCVFEGQASQEPNRCRVWMAPASFPLNGQFSGTKTSTTWASAPMMWWKVHSGCKVRPHRGECHGLRFQVALGLIQKQQGKVALADQCCPLLARCHSGRLQNQL